jgi:hypothetical protein
VWPGNEGGAGGRRDAGVRATRLARRSAGEKGPGAVRPSPSVVRTGRAMEGGGRGGSDWVSLGSRHMLLLVGVEGGSACTCYPGELGQASMMGDNK